jgi:hypothetical protein
MAGCASTSGKFETALFVPAEDFTMTYERIYDQVWG